MSATILPTMGQQEEGSGPQVTTAEDRSAQEQVERALSVKDIQPAKTNTAPYVEPDVHHQASRLPSAGAEDCDQVQATLAETGDRAPQTPKPASEIEPTPTMKSIIEGYIEDRTHDSFMDREHNIETESQLQFAEDREREQRRPGELGPTHEEEEQASYHLERLPERMYQSEHSSRHEDHHADKQAREATEAIGTKPTMHHPCPHSEQEDAVKTVNDEHRVSPDHKDFESRHHAGVADKDERMGSPDIAQKDLIGITTVGQDAAVKSGDEAMVASTSEDQDMPLRAPITSRSASPPASASAQPQARRHSAIGHGMPPKPDKVSPPAKRATTDSEQSAPTPKASRVKRELGKKLPKVYPPRKPRVRPAPVESLTMTMRTDSALSTLASAAVAIKNHQGPLSTLSVPQSPTVQAGDGTSVAPADASSQSTSSTTAATASTPAATAGAEETEAASASTSSVATASTTTATTSSGTAEPPLISGRSPFKEHLPQDAAGYRCELCPGERFGRVHDLKRHQISKHNEMTWPCDFCHRPFVRRDALLRHYSVKAARNDGVHPTLQEEDRLQEAKARAKLLS
ncbi:hypothetical protein BGZ70_000437 [Mortierella alpina]|uniref:C2H2-type domain-containing protein n=1 Tax=Mortierella alpina TaxID=64518 RepID=A0A9P6IYA9_MORAP|nr:hypothetical protein BGZ70_000437 [Mortierella alpina]